MTVAPLNGRLTGQRRGSGALKGSLAAARDTSRVPERDLVLSSGLMVVALLVAWVLLQTLVLGGLSYSRAQDRLYDELRTDLAAGTAPTGGVIAPGRPVALFSLPSLDIDQVVVEGTSAGLLLDGPGHRRDTVLPGQAGVSLVYGRSRTFGRPFHVMMHEAVGTRLDVVTGQGRSTYRIEGVRRAGDDVPAPPAQGQGRLTLITAAGDGRLGGLRPDELVYVDASLQSKPFPAGGQRVNTLGQSELAMANDTSVLPLLALTLGGLRGHAAAASTAAPGPRLDGVRTGVPGPRVVRRGPLRAPHPEPRLSRAPTIHRVAPNGRLLFTADRPDPLHRRLACSSGRRPTAHPPSRQGTPRA
jgi:hypothetical protein